MMKKQLLFISTFAFCAPAYAYLDPGTGSAILSAIVGIIVAFGVAIKTYWYKLKSVFFNRDSIKGNVKSADDDGI